MQKFKPGIYKDLDIEVYHKSEGISSSGMKVFLECPAQFYYEYYVNKNKADKQSFNLGRMIHLLALEPELFDKQYYIYSGGDLPRTDKAKAELLELAKGRQIIKPKDVEESKLIAEKLRKHKLMENIKTANIENSIFWEAGVFNAPLRARPDFYNHDVIVDIKTTTSFYDFERNFRKYGYHRQAAMQIDALKNFSHSRSFKFLVVQKKPPYLIAEYELHPFDIEIGRAEYLNIANDYAECLLYNEWPTKCEELRILESYRRGYTDD